jgi:hypothetical protein
VKNINEDFRALCEKHSIKNAVLGYEDDNESVGTLSCGGGSKQYEITAVLFGFYKSAYHSHIGDLLTYGGKEK